MEVECVECKIKMDNPAGFQTKQGFVCMRHEFEEMNTFTVSYSSMGDIVFKYKYDADFFIEEDLRESGGDFEDYTISYGKMNVLEFNNLEEWGG